MAKKPKSPIQTAPIRLASPHQEHERAHAMGGEKGRELWLPVERTPGTRRRWGMSVGMDCTSHALQVATSAAAGAAATGGEEEEQQEAAAAAGGGTHGGGGLAGYSAAPSVEASTGERAVSVTPPLGKKKKNLEKDRVDISGESPDEKKDFAGKPQ